VTRIVLVSFIGSLLAVGMVSGPVLAVAPGNDNFEANIELGSGTTGSASGTNVDATLQTDEPQFITQVQKTVWYSWTAPADGNVPFCVYGDTLNDSTLAIYTGNVLASLTPVVYNDDGTWGMGYFSDVVVNATNGTTYRIQVGGFDGWQGTFDLLWGGDCVAPAVTILFDPAPKVKGPKLEVSFTGGDDTTSLGDLVFSCQVDSDTPYTCSSPQAIYLPSGNHTLKIWAADLAGNVTVDVPTVNVTIKSKKFG
jgi:hypothetical protein